MLQKVPVESLELSPFQAIGKQWMLITAGSREDCTLMTASWGGFGVLWSVPSATVYVNPERFTHHILAREDYFSCSFLPETYRKALGICGTRSAREGNKWEASGLTPAFTEGGVPYVAQAELVVIVRKQLHQPIGEDCIRDPEVLREYYTNIEPTHHIFAGQVVELYREM